jgi:hypothetical protein
MPSAQVSKTNKALTNKFAGLFMILFTALLCFKVEAKGVKSNYFGDDLKIFSLISNGSCSKNIRRRNIL